MLRLAGLVIVIAVGDSLNPSTIAPVLYLASGDRPRLSVVEFTAAVFAVHFTAGVLLVLGPGHWLLSLIRQLDPTIRDILELAAGAAMTIAAGVSWHRRDRLAEKDLPTPTPKRKSSLLLGATIIAAELPTAFPYFAAIAAILGVVLLGGREAEDRLTRGREFVQDRWPTVLAGVLLVFGLFVAAVGAGGLI